MKLAFLNLLGTCIVRIQCVQIYFACTKRLFNLSRQTIINVHSARPRVKCALFPLKNKQNAFFLQIRQANFIFEETQKSIQDVIGDVCCPKCPNEKCVYISNNNNCSVFDCKKCKACSHVLNYPFKDQNLTMILFAGDGTHRFARQLSRDYEMEKPSPFLKNSLRQSQSSTPEPEVERAKFIRFLAWACCRIHIT